jgi:hypothetical protein
VPNQRKYNPSYGLAYASLPQLAAHDVAGFFKAVRPDAIEKAGQVPLSDPCFIGVSSVAQFGFLPALEGNARPLTGNDLVGLVCSTGFRGGFPLVARDRSEDPDGTAGL